MNNDLDTFQLERQDTYSLPDDPDPTQPFHPTDDQLDEAARRLAARLSPIGILEETRIRRRRREEAAR